MPHPALVGPLRRQSIVDVGDLEDSGEQRNVLAFEPVRISGAIPAFVMVPDDGEYRGQQRDGAADFLALHRVGAHHVPFAFGERPGLEQDRVRDRNLPDIMQIPGPLERFEILRAEAEPPAEPDAEVCEPGAVARGDGVPAFGGKRQGADGAVELGWKRKSRSKCHSGLSEHFEKTADVIQQGAMRTAVLLATFIVSPIIAENLSQKDRDFALSQLHATRKQVLDSTANLTEAQWKFRAAEDKWSVADVVEHLALVERGLFGLIQKTMAAPAAPKSAEQATDEAILKTMPDRSQKAQAPEGVRPASRYPAGPPLVNEFRTARDTTISWVRETQGDLRAHWTKSQYGATDCVQWLLYMSAHTERHLAQIAEIKGDAKFPR